MKNKLLKTLLPIASIGAIAIGCTQSLTSCNSDGNYDVTWNFAKDSKFNEFKPSTKESDLPTGSKDKAAALKFYLEKIKENKILFTDDFLYYFSELTKTMFPTFEGISETISISLISVNAEEGRISFKCKREINVPKDIKITIFEQEMIIPKEYTLISCEYTDFPFSVQYFDYLACWMFQPNISTASELKKDDKWKFSFQEKYVSKYTNREASGSYDSKAGETELNSVLSYIGANYFTSYYLSKITSN